MAFLRKIISPLIINNKKDPFSISEISCKYSLDECNTLLTKAITDNKPHLVCRFGNVETNGVYCQLLKEKNPVRIIPRGIKRELRINAGMFSTNFFGMHFFKKVMIKAIKEMDYVCLWNLGMFSERFLVKKYGNSKLTFLDLRVFEAFRFKEPWTMALKGKKVLVVSQNTETIKKQFNVKDKLFSGGIWPDFELLVYKPPLTNGFNKSNASWKTVFNGVKKDVLGMDFDVALLSCGSYGIPLCYEIYKIGKKAIYVGGILQFLFGIKGKRWAFDVKETKELINDYFCEPQQDSKPDGYEQIENGCYW